MVGEVTLHQRRHQQILGDDIPLRLGLGKSLVQPGLLLPAEQRAARVTQVAARGGDNMPLVAAIGRDARLLGTVLATVEHMETRKLAVIQAPVDAHVRPLRHAAGTQGHVFVKRLVRRGPLLEKLRHRHLRVLGPAVGVVILYFVIVPGYDAGSRGVQGLQVWISLVQCVAVAVITQALRIAAAVRTKHLARIRSIGTVVNIITEEKHQVRLLGGKVSVGAEIATFPVRAGHKPQPGRGHGLQRRHRARLAHRALRTEPFKLVPIRPIRRQPRHFDMHCVSETRRRQYFALLHNARHRRIAGHPPTQRHRATQAATAIRGVEQRRQARPDHKAIWQRVTGSHAEGERIIHPGTARKRAENRKRGSDRQPAKDPAPAVVHFAAHRQRSQSSRTVANPSMSSYTPFFKNAWRMQPS